MFKQAMDYLNVDFKFLTIVILLLTIGAVVVKFPRVRFYDSSTLGGMACG